MRIHTLLLATALAFALPAAAQRPSLIDLDTRLDQVVNGLCDGDASTCGATPAPAIAGQIDFDGGTFVLDFTSLTFGLSSPALASLSFADLEVTVDAQDATALVLAPLVNGTPFTTVDIRIPNPQGPGDVTILSLTGVTLQSLGVTSEGSLTPLELRFNAAQMSWLGSTSSWNATAQTGTGCTIPSGEKHTALAGSDPSLLQGDLEAEFGLSVAPLGNIALSYTRPTVASSACLLRGAGMMVDPMPTLRRLSPLSATFATPLFAETIEVITSDITSYSLTIEAGALTDVIVLGDPPTGKLTTRQFDPNTGQETSATVTNF